MENNKLIAEFMELEKCTALACKDDPCYYYADNYMKTHDLQYHTSWDWLMPVVEKINTMYFYGNPEIRIGKNRVELLCGFEEKHIYKAWRISKDISYVKTIYDAVVEFIKWYNQQKS